MKDEHCILCFGDSLTAGTSPPLMNNAPYGSHLEKALKDLACARNHENGNIDADSISVKWLGLPGWTADALLEQKTLESILLQLSNQKQEIANSATEDTQDPESESHKRPYPSLIIILAGTNDLANQVKVDPILNPIVQLHTIAHHKGIPTVALSIPTSAWQSQSKDARDLATSVNEGLKLWATSIDNVGDTESKRESTENGGKKKVTFVPFPIEAYDQQSGYWSFDGLHFSPEGYKYIGETLAPIILDILDS